jgi:TetR/AcrR family transcriptional repressor of nem operon
VRKSRQEAAQTRQRIVESASVEFRRRGIAGTGLADLMAAAGMTHGGFYKHFESKEQVVEESVALATETMLASMQASLSAAPGSRGLRTVMADYLSTAYRDDSSEGCPFVTLGSEMARSSEAVREAATAGFLQIVDMLAGQFEDLSPAAARKEAMLMFSTMIGAMTMARVVTDPRLSATLLQQARKHLAP